MLNYTWGNVVQGLGCVPSSLGTAMGTRGPHPPPQSWRDNELMVTVRDALMGVGRSEPSKHLPEGRVNLRKASQRNNLLVNDHFLSSFAELPAGRRGLEGNCWSRWD